MTPDLFWIPGPWPGKLAIAGRPRGGDWLGDEARGLRRAGVDLVVSLLETDEAQQLGLADEAKDVEASGLRFLSFPIPDRGVPSSAPAAASLVTALAGALEAGKNVAIHCRQSVGRSGLVAAAVLAGASLDPERAIAIVSAARGEPIPETVEQRSWLLHLPARVTL
jgi:protein-tyrosine phosphatase